MKNILLTLIFLITIACNNKPKKEVFKNLKAENEILVKKDIDIKSSIKPLTIQFKEYLIEFIPVLLNGVCVDLHDTSDSIIIFKFLYGPTPC